MLPSLFAGPKSWEEGEEEEATQPHNTASLDEAPSSEIQTRATLMHHPMFYHLSLVQQSTVHLFFGIRTWVTHSMCPMLDMWEEKTTYSKKIIFQSTKCISMKSRTLRRIVQSTNHEQTQFSVLNPFFRFRQHSTDSLRFRETGFSAVFHHFFRRSFVFLSDLNAAFVAWRVSGVRAVVMMVVVVLLMLLMLMVVLVRKWWGGGGKI